MRRLIRQLLDKGLTSVSTISIVFMALALVIILGPMIVRGFSAVLFDGTVEWRQLQLNEPLFDRGDAREIEAETQRTDAARQKVYDLLDRFSRGIDVEPLIDRTKQIQRELEAQIENRLSDRITSEDSSQTSDVAVQQQRRETISDFRQQAAEIIKHGRRIQRYLERALEADENDKALRYLDRAMEYDHDGSLDGTVAEAYFQLAREYRRTVEEVDLARREKYRVALLGQEPHTHGLKDYLYQLWGPRPGQKPQANLMRVTYGATRWDQALQIQEKILNRRTRVPDPDSGWLKEVIAPRSEDFDGELDELFALIGDDEYLRSTLNPRFTVYWQYFIDPANPTRLFGGVGPEIVGTALLSLLAMAFALPTGVMTAAFLVECTRGGPLVRAIRMCINTLAGVPSVIFGLFGLAFFMGWFLPKFGLRSEKSILAGGLTLGVLVLPVVIRSTEEAIRAVPRSYKEGALSLGAGGFKTFMTVTLPAALPGVLTGFILSLSRAAGETAAIMFVATVASGGGYPWNPLEGTVALSYSSYVVAVGDDVAAKAPHQQFGMIMTLILLVLILNIAAILIRSRMSKKLRGQ